jgi:uncharacterized protein with PIN domain
MIRFLLDENFNGKIVRGLRARRPDVDMIRVQDTELSGADDPAVLEWAARQGRILLTHDLDTMTKYANERLAQGLLLADRIAVQIFTHCVQTTFAERRFDQCCECHLSRAAIVAEV